MRELLKTAAACFAVCTVFCRPVCADTNATLAVDRGDGITIEQVSEWIDTNITNSAKRLIIMTQCFGGNSVHVFSNKTNTVVLSATTNGQQAVYTGYDLEAAFALKAGTNRTAMTIHTQAAAKAKSGETPTTGGGLDPSGFPMDPASSTGAVRSRHIIVYAGKPDDRPGRDYSQLNIILSAYFGKAFTTVFKVMGFANNPEDNQYPATAAGLLRAIKEARFYINTSPDPSKEQLILFITDHGNLRNTVATNALVSNASLMVFSNLPTFNSSNVSPQTVLGDAQARPGFSFFIPFGGALVWPGGTNFVPFIPSNSVQLGFIDPLQPAFFGQLNQFEELPFEEDDNEIGGTNNNEGIRIFFPMPRENFVQTFNRTLTIGIQNNSGMDFPVSEVAVETGPIRKSFEPELISLVYSADSNQVEVAWEAEAYADFFVQSASEPGDTNWTDEAGPLNSADGIFEFTTPPGPGVSKTFRITGQ